MKNDNEYEADGKRYIVEIRRCEPVARIRDIFTLNCRIHQRGEKEYLYIAGKGRIKYRKQILWLTEKSLHTVEDAVSRFSLIISDRLSPESDCLRVPFDSLGVNLYCREEDDLGYSVLYEDKKADRYLFREYIDIEEMPDAFGRFGFFGRPDAPEELPRPTAANYRSHPLYLAAREKGDVYLQWRMDRIYAGESNLDGEIINREREKGNPGPAVIVKADDRCDRDYYLSKPDPKTVRLLRKSGYRFLHKPYMARGAGHFTGSRITVNPHAMSAVDAAPSDGVPLMEWEEFFRLFGR